MTPRLFSLSVPDTSVNHLLWCMWNLRQGPFRTTHGKTIKHVYFYNAVFAHSKLVTSSLLDYNVCICHFWEKKKKKVNSCKILNGSLPVHFRLVLQETFLQIHVWHRCVQNVMHVGGTRPVGCSLGGASGSFCRAQICIKHHFLPRLAGLWIFQTLMLGA